MVIAAMELKDSSSLEESYDKTRQHIKKQTLLYHYIKVRLVKAMIFLVVMYGCESWATRKLSTEELMLLNCGDREFLRVP